MLLVLAAALTATAPVAPPRQSDLGRFIVSRVLIDPALDNNEQRFFANDPRFVGRYVDIAPQRLAFDGASACTAVKRTWTRASVAAVLRASLSRRSSNHPRHPRPADMGLSSKQAGVRPVDVVRYDCLTPDTGRGPVPGRDWADVFGFPLGTGQRALLWEGEVLLVLAPAASAAAGPSFACLSARNASEQAVCHDRSLASWDRSVAAAYRLALKGEGDDFVATDNPEALVQSQREWVRSRDACAAARQCLEDRMSERVDALMRRQF